MSVSDSKTISNVSNVSSNKTKTKSGLPKNTCMMQYRDGKRLIVTFYYFDAKTRKVVYGSAIDRPDPKDEKSEVKVERKIEQKTKKTKAQIEHDVVKAAERKILDGLCKTAVARTVHADALNFVIPIDEWNAAQDMSRSKNLVIAQLNQRIFDLENPDVEINKLESRQDARDTIALAFKSDSLVKAKALKKRIMDNIKAEDVAKKAQVDKTVNAQVRLDMDKYVCDTVKAIARTQKQIVVKFV